jgi:hypothetical protein
VGDRIKCVGLDVHKGGIIVMAHLGLAPSEHSREPASNTAASPKVGNSAARRLLIEAACSYRFRARIARELLLRQEEQPKRSARSPEKAHLRPRFPPLQVAGKRIRGSIGTSCVRPSSAGREARPS